MIHTVEAELCSGRVKVAIDTEKYSVVVSQVAEKATDLESTVTLELDGMDAGPDMLRGVGEVFVKLAKAVEEGCFSEEFILIGEDEDDEEEV